MSVAEDAPLGVEESLIFAQRASTNAQNRILCDCGNAERQNQLISQAILDSGNSNEDVFLRISSAMETQRSSLQRFTAASLAVNAEHERVKKSTTKLHDTIAEAWSLIASQRETINNRDAPLLRFLARYGSDSPFVHKCFGVSVLDVVSVARLGAVCREMRELSRQLLRQMNGLVLTRSVGSRAATTAGERTQNGRRMRNNTGIVVVCSGPEEVRIKKTLLAGGNTSLLFVAPVVNEDDQSRAVDNMFVAPTGAGIIVRGLHGNAPIGRHTRPEYVSLVITERGCYTNLEKHESMTDAEKARYQDAHCQTVRRQQQGGAMIGSNGSDSPSPLLYLPEAVQTPDDDFNRPSLTNEDREHLRTTINHTFYAPTVVQGSSISDLCQVDIENCPMKFHPNHGPHYLRMCNVLAVARSDPVASLVHHYHGGLDGETIYAHALVTHPRNNFALLMATLDKAPSFFSYVSNGGLQLLTNAPMFVTGANGCLNVEFDTSDGTSWHQRATAQCVAAPFRFYGRSLNGSSLPWLRGSDGEECSLVDARRKSDGGGAGLELLGNSPHISHSASARQRTLRRIVEQNGVCRVPHGSGGGIRGRHLLPCGTDHIHALLNSSASPVFVVRSAAWRKPILVPFELMQDEELSEHRNTSQQDASSTAPHSHERLALALEYCGDREVACRAAQHGVTHELSTALGFLNNDGPFGMPSDLTLEIDIGLNTVATVDLLAVAPTPTKESEIVTIPWFKSSAKLTAVISPSKDSAGADRGTAICFSKLLGEIVNAVEVRAETNGDELIVAVRAGDQMMLVPVPLEEDDQWEEVCDTPIGEVRRRVLRFLEQSDKTQTWSAQGQNVVFPPVVKHCAGLTLAGSASSGSYSHRKAARFARRASDYAVGRGHSGTSEHLAVWFQTYMNAMHGTISNEEQNANGDARTIRKLRQHMERLFRLNTMVLFAQLTPWVARPLVAARISDLNFSDRLRSACELGIRCVTGSISVACLGNDGAFAIAVQRSSKISKTETHIFHVACGTPTVSQCDPVEFSVFCASKSYRDLFGDPVVPLENILTARNRAGTESGVHIRAIPQKLCNAIKSQILDPIAKYKMKETKKRKLNHELLSRVNGKV